MGGANSDEGKRVPIVYGHGSIFFRRNCLSLNILCIPHSEILFGKTWHKYCLINLQKVLLGHYAITRKVFTERSTMERICIIGGGNGAFAAASDMALRGHQVSLFEMPEFGAGIKAIQEKGGIQCKCLPSNQLKEGFAKLHKITTDVTEAFVDSDVIFVITPATAHENIAKTISPHIHEDQILVLSPANFGGSIRFRDALLANGCSEKTRVAEFDCMMYATRKTGPDSCWIRGYKHNMGCAVFPSKYTEEVYERLKRIYPTLVKRDNVLITGISNINSIGHPACMLGNISILDGGQAPLMNSIKTESVAKIRRALDNERMQLRSIGLNLTPLPDIYQSYYAYQGATGTPDEAWRFNPIYVDSKFPTSWSHRYLTEDIPFGLVPMEELLDQYNLPHPVMTACINLAELLCDQDFRATGMKLSSCHLKGLTQEELLQYMETGKL